MLKRLILKFFDYDIIGYYYDNDGKGTLTKKYLKKWKIRKRKG